MGKPNKEKKKREQKRLAEKKDPVLQAQKNRVKQEQFKENIKAILLFTAKALLPAVLCIMIFAMIFNNLPTSPHNEAFGINGFVGAALLGVGISLFLYGKKAYKFLAPAGIALALLSCLLMSRTGLTGESSARFYYLNILFSLIFIVFYFMFRDGVHSWLRGRKISDSMIRKSKTGAKNFWWYEELHESFGLSSIYTLNKTYTVFFAAHLTASVLLGWAEPLFRIFAVSFTLIAILTTAMAEFARMQETFEKYGCKFVLFRKNPMRGNFDSSLFDMMVSLFPVLLAVCFWITINDM